MFYAGVLLKAASTAMFAVWQLLSMLITAAMHGKSQICDVAHYLPMMLLAICP